MTKAHYSSDVGKRRAAAKFALRNEYTALYEDLTTEWSGLTQPAKQEALRAGLVLCLKAVNYLLRSE